MRHAAPLIIKEKVSDTSMVLSTTVLKQKLERKISYTNSTKISQFLFTTTYSENYTIPVSHLLNDTMNKAKNREGKPIK